MAKTSAMAAGSGIRSYIIRKDLALREDSRSGRGVWPLLAGSNDDLADMI